MRTRRLLIVVSAPSGGGKTTICEELLKQDVRLARSISATTRPPRAGERNKRDYYFIPREQFRIWRRARRFLEWAVVHGHEYGTPKAGIRAQQAAGRDVLLVIDVQGGLAVKRQCREAVLIFIRPPSLKILRGRLAGRGTESRAAIAERLRNARKEMEAAEKYDYIVLNQDLPSAVQQVRSIITAERLRVNSSRIRRQYHASFELGKNCGPVGKQIRSRGEDVGQGPQSGRKQHTRNR